MMALLTSDAMIETIVKELASGQQSLDKARRYAIRFGLNEKVVTEIEAADHAVQNARLVLRQHTEET